MTNSPIQSILFVCAGNTCRSPMAEGVMKHLLSVSGLDQSYSVESRATRERNLDAPPTPFAVRASTDRGYDISAIRVRRLSKTDFESFDLILAMDHINLERLREVAPAQALHRIRLFLDADSELAGSDVADPFSGTLKDYERTLTLVERGCQAWLRKLSAGMESL